MKEGLGDNTLNFYDLTLKSNYRLNDNNQLFLSGYFGRDNFTFGDNAGFNWGNKTGTLRWNHLFSNRLFANTTLYYSNYDYSLRFGDGANDTFDWSARIINTSVKPRFTWFLNDRQQLRFGGQAIRYEFQPANAEVVTDDETLDISLDKRYALEGDLYLEHELSLGSRWQLNYGLRWSIFNLMGKGEAYTFGDSPAGQPRPLVDVQTYGWGETIQSYNNWEPRAALRFQVNPEQSLKLSYNRTVQYIHLVSNTIAATPVDVWLPSTNNVQPQQADQVAVGYFRNFRDNAFEASVEAYYKDMRHQVDYVDGANLMLNEYVEGQVLEGRGRAYGLEFLLRKNPGRLTGWVSYTLSRSERLVEGVNNDEWYANRFDQTHNLSLTGMYELSDRWSFSAVFVYNSGAPANFPTSRYQQGDYVIPHNTGGERNNVRIPGYHRLDLSATLQGKHNGERLWQSYWVFSVYNAYNRQNPFAIFARQNPNRPVPGEAVTTEAVRFSVVGHVIPSVAYNFKF
jgi:hypothetical protein